MKSNDTAPGVLVIGRSKAVIDDTVELLSERGYDASATNDFESIADRFDPRALDLVVLGGQVPPAAKDEIREQILAANDAVVFVQGLSGIPGLIADQVAGALAGEPPVPGQSPLYDSGARKITLSLYASLDVEVTIYWVTELVPPDPKSDSVVLHDGSLPAGDHAFEVPAVVSLDAAFATVRAGGAIWSFRLEADQGAGS